MTSAADDRFERLCRQVANCRRCPRMAASARILSDASGALTAALMFIGEAPGRLGADRSMVPFHGDVSGRNFESFLAAAELSREQIFVTNAVLCNPRDSRGNNTTPNRAEARNCITFLDRQIELVDPAIVVTLGAVALRAIESIEAHGLNLRDAVAQPRPWSQRTLIPLYHPGARALIHRPRELQQADYRFVAECLRTARRRAL